MAGILLRLIAWGASGRAQAAAAEAWHPRLIGAFLPLSKVPGTRLQPPQSFTVVAMATSMCLCAGPLRSRSHPPAGPRVTARCQPVVFEGKRLDGAVHRNLEEGPRELRLPFHSVFWVACSSRGALVSHVGLWTPSIFTGP